MSLAGLAGLGLGGAVAAQVLVIPTPDMSDLEAVVREQIVAAQALAETTANDPDAEAAARAEAWGAAGQLYHAYDFREAAEACYRNAAGEAPSDFRWHYLLGISFQSDGAFDEAESAFTAALALRAEPAAHFHLGEVFREQNRLDEAELAFFDAHAAGGGSAARAALGEIAMLRRDFPAAIAHFEAALEAAPEANRLHYLLGMAFRASGDPERAKEHLERSGPVGIAIPDPIAAELESLKRGERIHVLRGRTAFRLGRYEEAAEAFQLALAAEPESYRAHVNLATALGTMGSIDEAMAIYRRALEIDPEGETANANLGVLLNHRGEHEAAAAHLERAIARVPDDWQVNLELARALAASGEGVSALRHYDRAEALASDEDVLLEAVQWLINETRYKEALERLEASIDRDPTLGRTTAALARFLAGSPDHALRDGERALDLATRAFEASPTASQAETLAMALAELGRCGEAADWQQEAVAAAEPAMPDAHVAGMRDRLERYASGPPCAPP